MWRPSEQQHQQQQPIAALGIARPVLERVFDVLDVKESGSLDPFDMLFGVAAILFAAGCAALQCGC